MSERHRDELRQGRVPLAAVCRSHHGSAAPPEGTKHRQMHRQTGTFERAKRSPRILDGARRRSPPLLARDWAYDAGGLARYWAPGTSGSLPASFQRESFILSELRCSPSTRAASLTLDRKSV